MAAKVTSRTIPNTCEAIKASIIIKDASTTLKRRSVKPSPIRKLRKLKRNVLPPQTKRRLDGTLCLANCFCCLGMLDAVLLLTALADTASEDSATSMSACDFSEDVGCCKICPSCLSNIYLYLVIIGSFHTSLQFNGLTTLFCRKNIRNAGMHSACPYSLMQHYHWCHLTFTITIHTHEGREW